MTNSQNNIQPNPSPRYKKKAPSRGGKRNNAGRKRGSIEKIRASVLLNEIYRTTKQSFSQILVEEMNKARLNGDTKLTAQYLQWIGNKVVADKVDIDHTTNGEPIQTVFNFPQQELPEWTPEIQFRYEQK